MEFDNDKKRPKVRFTDWLIWLPLLSVWPLVNSITQFSSNWKLCVVLFVMNLVMAPGYFIYARTVVYRYYWDKQYVYFGMLTVFAFSVAHALLFSLFGLLRVTCPPLGGTDLAFFTYSVHTFWRESIWILLNLYLASTVGLYQRSTEEKESREQIHKENLFYKLRYLRAQLNPHFLFNTLNSIYSLSLQKSGRAAEVVVKLADLMRYLIYECNEEQIPLDKEIAFIRNYIEIEQVRYKADIRFNVEGDTKDIMIEPFLFIAFIENGFKHAMDSTDARPFIYITLKVGKGRIVLNVINSTDADLELQAKRINGKGLTQSRSLLELLYPGLYELDIIQTEREPSRYSELRLVHARERLESLYPQAYDLDVMLNNSAFTVSLILKTRLA